MDRRGFLTGLATSVAAVLSGCAASTTTHAAGIPSPSETGAVPPDSILRTPPNVFHAPSGIVRVPVPEGTLTMLPGQGNLVALTVDDGTDADVLRAYALLAQRTGLRLTFFANGYMKSWTDHAPLLRPLIDMNQAIISNHTWSHQDLSRLSDSQIAVEIQQNEKFLTNLYGTNGRPFLRPPYGIHNARVDRMLAELGYPAVTMWWGSLGDATEIPTAMVLANAEKWILPQRLVIGHANHPGVLSVMDKIVDIIRTRNLQPVHLADIFDVTRLPPAPTTPPSPLGSPSHSASPSAKPAIQSSRSASPSGSPSPTRSSAPSSN